MGASYPPFDPGSAGEPDGHRRRIVMVLIIVGALVVVGGCAAALTLPRMAADRSLDPSINKATGLPDGRYLMTATASYHRDDACWFRGMPRGPALQLDTATEVTVYGTGSVQCAGATYGAVNFSVVDGVAAIDKSNP